MPVTKLYPLYSGVLQSEMGTTIKDNRDSSPFPITLVLYKTSKINERTTLAMNYNHHYIFVMSHVTSPCLRLKVELMVSVQEQSCKQTINKNADFFYKRVGTPSVPTGGCQLLESGFIALQGPLVNILLRKRALDLESWCPNPGFFAAFQQDCKQIIDLTGPQALSISALQVQDPIHQSSFQIAQPKGKQSCRLLSCSWRGLYLHSCGTDTFVTRCGTRPLGI